jgi:outer membrane lipoprotein-sorting protein
MKMLVCLALLVGAPLAAQPPSGSEILDAIDDNLSSDNRIVEARMIIHGRRGSRTLESRSWGEGTERSFTEYLSPPREAGTKMLKLEDNLWTYSPSTDRTIQISGHLLRQSVMGSDLSYEDLMDDRPLQEIYEATVVGDEQIDGRDCWIVQLEATEPEVAYQSRRLWVDRERMIPLRQELYGKSGRLLKTLEMTDPQQIDGRWYPMRSHFKDELKSGAGTEFVIDEIAFDQEIPAHVFTRASLRR